MAALEAHAATANDCTWQVQLELDAEASRLHILLVRAVCKRDDAAATANRLRHDLARATTAAQNSAKAAHVGYGKLFGRHGRFAQTMSVVKSHDSPNCS
ncbi:hypothetical protein HK405_001717, partial [Cladochytrium tenue]